MNRGLNKVMIIGRLGRDPEMRYTPSGRPVTTFSVGTNRSWNTANGERRTETEWFNVVAWSSLAEICKQYLLKDSGGEVSKTDVWGKRQLAYPIRKYTEGQYFLLNVNMAPTFGVELDRNLRFLEPVIRYMLVAK